MNNKSNVVLGIFKSPTELEKSIVTLKAEGFINADISVLVPSSSASEELLMTKGTKLGEGAATGSGAGAVIGGTLGLLLGLGALTVPGLGVFLAAGPIMATLAGLGLGSAFGGISGALVGMGFPEFEAKLYESHIKKGGILIAIHGDSIPNLKSAANILKEAGAIDITTTSESKGDNPRPTTELESFIV